MGHKRIVKVAILVAYCVVILSAAASSVAAQSATVSAENASIENVGGTAEADISIDADQGVASADVIVSINNKNAEITGVNSVSGNANAANQTSDSVKFEYTDIGASQQNIKLGTVVFNMTKEVRKDVEIKISTNNFNTATGSFDTVSTEQGTLSLGGLQATVSAQDASIQKAGGTADSAISLDANNGVAEANVTVSIDTQTAEIRGAVAGDAQVTQQNNRSATFHYTDSAAGKTNIDFGSITFEMTQETSEDIPISVTADNVLALEDGKHVPFDSVQANDAVLSLNGQVSVGTATVITDDVSIQKQSGTAKTMVSVQADDGIGGIDVNLSVDDTNVSISNASIVDQPGNSDTEITRSSSLVTIKYTDIGAQKSSLDLATVEFEMTADVEDKVNMNLEVPFAQDGNQDDFEVSTQPGTISLGTKDFTDTLIEDEYFIGPPTNTAELNDTLYEDLSGDGNGTDVEQTVRLFGFLLRGGDLGLTPQQAKKLDWDSDGGNSVDIPDMVDLFGRQIRYNGSS